jgi:nitrate reductase gamma subunit
MDFLNYVIFENSIKSWLIALGILVGVFLILALIKWIINNRLINRVKESKTEVDNFIIPVLNQLNPAAGFLGYRFNLILCQPECC